MKIDDVLTFNGLAIDRLRTNPTKVKRLTKEFLNERLGEFCPTKNLLVERVEVALSGTGMSEILGLTFELAGKTGDHKTYGKEWSVRDVIEADPSDKAGALLLTQLFEEKLRSAVADFTR